MGDNEGGQGAGGDVTWVRRVRQHGAGRCDRVVSFYFLRSGIALSIWIRVRDMQRCRWFGISALA